MAKSKGKRKSSKKRGNPFKKKSRGRRRGMARGVRGFVQPGLLPVAAGATVGMFAMPLVVSKIPVAFLQSGIGNIIGTVALSALLGGLAGKFAGKGVGLGIAAGGIAGAGVRAFAQWQAQRAAAAAPPPAAPLRGYVDDSGVSGYVDDGVGGYVDSDDVAGYVEAPVSYAG